MFFLLLFLPFSTILLLLSLKQSPSVAIAIVLVALWESPPPPAQFLVQLSLLTRYNTTATGFGEVDDTVATTTNTQPPTTSVRQLEWTIGKERSG